MYTLLRICLALFKTNPFNNKNRFNEILHIKFDSDNVLRNILQNLIQ